MNRRNWQTQSLILWLDSSEGARMIAEEAAREGEDALFDLVTGSNPLDETPSWFSEVITEALREVSWEEIMEFFLE